MTDSEHKKEAFDKRYMRMACIWAENSYCERRKVRTVTMALLQVLRTCAKMTIM